ncbi:MAG: S41 family peptidase, partial [Planctomycetota bacterium]
MLTNRVTLSVLLLISSSCLLAVGLRPELVQRGADDDLRTLAEVYTIIQDRFREEQDSKELAEAAIAGMLESLDDPYTEYIPPAAVRDFDKDVRGEYVGIGAEVDSREGFLRIASPMDGSPAWNTGLEPDDLVVGVDGVSTFSMPLTDIIDRLLGEPDTRVVVTVERAGDESDWPDGARPASELSVAEPEEGGAAFEASPPIKAGRTRFDLTIVRKPIVTVTTKGLYREGEDWAYFADEDDRIAYVRLTQFTDTTPATLEETLRPLVADGLNGLVLDLRYNTGGSLLAAIQTADLFLERGDIVSVRGRGREAGRAKAERTRNELPWFPMVVLVNGGSASASEIVAGALKDNDRAVVLGQRTFGKGSVQGVYPLRSGDGALKITEQYYYLPSGKLLHRTDDSTDWGVDPTDGFYVPMEPEDAIEMWRLRREAETLRADALDGDWGDPAW